jgi:hypothetical protein
MTSILFSPTKNWMPMYSFSSSDVGFDTTKIYGFHVASAIDVDGAIVMVLSYDEGTFCGSLKFWSVVALICIQDDKNSVAWCII